MQEKLVVLFILVLLAFVFLIGRIFSINRNNGEEYKKQVLSQQSYDSRELPFRRGTITDSKGTILANSELVYNVIIDAYQMNNGPKNDEGISIYLEPSLDAAPSLGLDRAFIAGYVRDNPDSRYYVARKNLPYSEKVAFEQSITDAAARVSNIRESISEEREGTNDEARIAQLELLLEEAENENRRFSNIKGIWFEPAYIRSYPSGSLASNLIGFANNNNEGSFGLEGYYNDTLNGTAGREYGYLNDDSTLERTIVDAIDGNNLVLTIDANIQNIVEKYILKFNEQFANNHHEGYGARNIGCIIQNVNNGEILAMACYPNYDLSDPYNTDLIVGMPKLNDRDQPTYEYMSQEDVDALDSEQQSRYLNALWRNYCISEYYEPGSVAKPFTMAAGIESGHMTGNESYLCEGSMNIGGWDIYCHNTHGDGWLTACEAIERSCNVALMQMALATGIDDFTRFQRIFNFGLKTNIDLADEARTDTLIYQPSAMGITDLATNSFGQNFDVTMIQMITAFSSLVNGGNYYEPHVVKKITSPTGATVRNIEPRLLKKTISAATSEKVKEGTLAVVAGVYGTGHTARPAGYMIGGKTGTAETYPRDHTNYVVSFMGYAPADDPQIAIYVVVDRANTWRQDDAKYATGIVRGVLTEVLPYLGIYMTEPLTEAEEAELREMNIANTLAYGAGSIRTAPRALILNLDTDGDGKYDAVDGNGDGAADTPLDSNGDDITDCVDVDGDGKADFYDTDNDGRVDSEKPADGQMDLTRQVTESGENASQVVNQLPVWKTYSVDPQTGYYVNPTDGTLIDPETGHSYGITTMSGFETENSQISSGQTADPEQTAGQ